MDRKLLTEEQLMLSRSEAHCLLVAAGADTHSRVVRVCDDNAILYIDARSRPYTAWLDREPSAAISVRLEPGFSSHRGSVARVSDPVATARRCKPDAGQIESD